MTSDMKNQSRGRGACGDCWERCWYNSPLALSCDWFLVPIHAGYPNFQRSSPVMVCPVRFIYWQLGPQCASIYERKWGESWQAMGALPVEEISADLREWSLVLSRVTWHETGEQAWPLATPQSGRPHQSQAHDLESLSTIFIKLLGLEQRITSFLERHGTY